MAYCAVKSVSFIIVLKLRRYEVLKFSVNYFLRRKES